MPTKDELEGKVEELQKALEEKQEELTKAQHVIESLETAGPGVGGWVVETENKGYNGETLGVHFVNGRAFIEDKRGGEAVANELKNDFGYSVTKVSAEDVAKMRSEAESVAEGYSEGLMELYAPPEMIGE